MAAANAGIGVRILDYAVCGFRPNAGHEYYIATPAHIHVKVDARQLRSVLEDFPRPGVRGVFEPDRVWLETSDGVLIEERRVARDSAGRVPRRPVWDDFDLLYFFGYVAWNYLFTPYLFPTAGIRVPRGCALARSGWHVWRGLQVRYPLGFPAHCREQTLYFAADGLLRRLDYTADVFSPLARGAHYTEQHKSYDGLVFPDLSARLHARPRRKAAARRGGAGRLDR